MRMSTAVACVAITAVGGAGWSGCGGARQGVGGRTVSPRAAPAERDEPRVSALAVEAADPPEGVTVMDVSCARDATERCNAVDDDCDATVDEGCGWRGGKIQVAAMWNSGADVNLRVEAPGGEVIDAASPRAGGMWLDHEGRGDCEPSAAHARVENVRWARDELPPRGSYRVAVRRVRSCRPRSDERGEAPDANATTVTVSVAALGRVLGVYNVTLDAGDPHPVVRFELVSNAR